MIDVKSSKHKHIAALADMRLYYTECSTKAMPGSRAWDKFNRYIAALDYAIAELSVTSERKDGVAL